MKGRMIRRSVRKKDSECLRKFGSPQGLVYIDKIRHKSILEAWQSKYLPVFDRIKLDESDFVSTEMHTTFYFRWLSFQVSCVLSRCTWILL